MSWLEKIKSNFIIKTGDGKTFKPLWINATKAVEYNIAEFEFPNLPGTLVKRGTPKGGRYNLEFYFEGEDHLDQSLAFEISARDSRAWVISHPMYDNITVQPMGLIFDNTKYNTTKITGPVIETITDDSPKINVVPVDKITEDKTNCDSLFAENYTNNVVPDATDINTMNSNVAVIYAKGAKVSPIPNSEDYFNLFSDAKSDILNATDDPLKAIQSIQAMIAAPALFLTDVKTRLALLIDQFNALRTTVINIFSPNAKRLYENNMAALISSMALATANPQEGGNDYATKNTVIDAIEKVLNSYNLYVSDLDSLQTANGGEMDSYIPDADSLIALNNLVNYTLSNLFTIALGAKQERIIYAEKDTNAIILTHRFYGLDVEDKNIETFMLNNNMGLSEMLQIKKGRRIVYYVG